MSDPTPIVCVLDVLAAVKLEELEGLVPVRPVQLRFSERLPALSGTADAPTQRPYDWRAIGKALDELGRAVKQASAAAGDAEVHLYVAGRAPLPAFVLLGQALNFAPTATRTVINPQRGGPWTAYPLAGTTADDRTPFFDVVDGLDRVQNATGRVALFVSTVGSAAAIDAIVRLFETRGETLAGIVEIRTAKPGDVAAAHMPAIAEELRERLSQVPGMYPRAGRFAIFVAGPAPLAFAVGQALNPNVYGKDVWVADYHAPDYEHALSLPFRIEGAPPISDGDGDRLARREVMDALLDGIDELRRSLDAEDFAATGASGEQRTAWIRCISELEVVREPEGEEFGLSILRRRLSIGRGLLEALRSLSVEARRGFGQLLLLHELFHDGQQLYSTNYHDVGRAGTVLEDVDYAADAFALVVLVSWDLRRGGPRRVDRAGEVAAEWIGFALDGIEAFDRLEHGERIESLYERRLRRYLIWYLNQARARTIRSGTHALTDIAHLFRGRLAVELAPVAGHLDPQFDKVVTRATPQTELFAALDGHLVREPRRPGFDPARLVDLVRVYDGPSIERELFAVVDAHRAVLVPWAVG